MCFEFSAAFELAKKDAGCVFAKQGDTNVERIKCSRYFQALLQKSKANAADQVVRFSAYSAYVLFYSFASLTSFYIGSFLKVISELDACFKSTYLWLVVSLLTVILFPYMC